MMDKQFDILLLHLLDRLRKIYFEDLSTTMIPIGAANTLPSVADIEYAALVSALYILHIHRVEMDTDFPDILELQPDIENALSALEELRESLADSRDRHNQIMDAMAGFDFNANKYDA